MRRPRLRIRLPAPAVAAIVAIASAVVVYHMWPTTWLGSPEAYVPASAVFAGIWGLGAMRHPRSFLAAGIGGSLVIPQVHDSSAYDLFTRCCTFACLLGAVAGWFMRGIRRLRADRIESVRLGQELS